MKNVLQGSPEWLEGRKSMVTGSRVAAILGLDKYKTRDDVLREMVRDYHGAEREFAGNEATAYGQEYEPVAITKYEELTGSLVISTGQHVHPDHDWLAASPDGLVDEDGLIEVKCPFRARYTSINEVPHYAAQIQLQLEVTERSWCDFVVYRDDAITIERVKADPLWIHDHLPALEAFHADYLATIADDELYARHLLPLVREDATWAALEAEYAAAKAASEATFKRLEKANAALIKEAGSQSQRGKLFQVIRAERQGSIAYAKAINELAPDADLSRYTGKPTVYFTVKEAKQ